MRPVRGPVPPGPPLPEPAPRVLAAHATPGREDGDAPAILTGNVATRNSAGFALLLALLVLLALGTLGTGLLFVSTLETRVSRALVHATRARAAAESAARAALTGWDAPAHRRLAPGTAVDVAVAPDALDPDVHAHARVVRLAGGLFLIRAEAEIRPPAGAGAHAAVGLLTRALHPAEFGPDFSAAVSAAGPVVLLPGAVVDGAGSAEPAATPDCPPDPLLGVPSGPRAGIAIADAPLLRVEPSAALHGAPPLEIAAHLADSAAFSGLGPLGMVDVTRLADRLVAEGLDLTAGPGGDGCDVGSAGAGSLDGAVGSAGAPCSGDAQLIFSPGRLTVSGAGRGVLVVDGDLELAPGAAFAGAILATGRLTLAPGASVTGAVRAREASIAGAIRFDACALARAFAEAPGLNRPLRPAGRSWVPTF